MLFHYFHRNPKNKKGFTLIELMISVAVFGILMVFLSGLLVQNIALAKRETFLSDLRMNAKAAASAIERTADKGVDNNVKNGELVSPVADYRFDETTESSFTYDSASGYQAQMIQNTSITSSSIKGNALNLSINDAAIVQNDIMNAMTNYTMSAWAKISWDTQTANQNIALFGRGQNKVYLAFSKTAGIYSVQLRQQKSGDAVNNGNTVSYQFGTTFPYSKQWVHITGSKTGSNMFLYINGVMLAKIGTATYNPADITNMKECTLGTGVDGQIDEFKLYNRCLSNKEVYDLYNTKVVEYKFDETSGSSIAQDASGNGNNSKLKGNATLAQGRIGNALTLDGNSGTYVQVPNGIMKDVGSFTFSTWYNTSTSNNSERIFDFGNSNTTGYMFLGKAAGSVYKFAITKTAVGGEASISSASTYTTNKWEHLAITVDYNSSSNNAKIFINGYLSATGTINIKPNELGNTTNNFIGKSQSADPYFNGKIDMFKIYAHAMSDQEIFNIYEQEKYKTELDEDLVLRYTFDNITFSAITTSGITKPDSIVYDISQNHNNGVLNLDVSTHTGISTTAKFGNSLNLIRNGVGTGDIVKIPAQTLNTLNDFTVSMWLNPSTTSSSCYFFGIGTTPDAIMASSDNKQYWYNVAGKFFGSSYLNPSGSYVGFEADKWSQLTLTLKGSHAIMYVNGYEIGRKENMTAKPSDFAMDLYNQIGNLYQRNTNFDGKIDDFRVYNKALSKNEITEILFKRAQYTFDDQVQYNEDITGNFGFADATATTTFVNGVYKTALDTTTKNFTNMGNLWDSTNNGKEFAFSFWINPSVINTDVNERIFRNLGSGTTSTSALLTSSGTKNRLQWNIDNSGSVNLYSTSAVTTASWHNAIFTYKSNTYSMYLDGVQVATTTSAVVVPNTVTSCFMGSLDAAGTSGQFKGYLDDFRMYEKALSPAEIQDLYIQNPYLYYKFDEGSGDIAGDSSGNNFNGELKTSSSNKGYDFSEGKYGYALNLTSSKSFLGTKQGGYVNVPANLYTSISDFTISGYFCNKGLESTWSRIFDFGSGGSNYMFLTNSINGTNNLNFGMEVGGSGKQEITGPVLNKNQWYHFAVTQIGTKVTLYLDGVEVGNMTTTYSPYKMGNTSQNYIGKSIYNDDYLNAKVDDFRIYPIGLSEDGIYKLYSTKQKSLVQYDFDKSITDTESSTYSGDLSQNGFSGLSNGTTLPFDASGKFGNALYLDGTNDYLDINRPSKYLKINGGEAETNKRDVSLNYSKPSPATNSLEYSLDQGITWTTLGAMYFDTQEFVVTLPKGNGPKTVQVRDNTGRIDTAVIYFNTISITEVDDNFDSNAITDPVKISDDGRYIVFSTTSRPTGSGYATGTKQVYWKDTQTGETTLCSISTSYAAGNGASTVYAISGDGKNVVFKSSATNMIAGDVNARDDLFVWNKDTNIKKLVNCSGAGAFLNDSTINGYVYIDYTGTKILYKGQSTTLSGDVNSHAFLRTLSANVTSIMNRTTAGAIVTFSGVCAMSSNGQWIIYSTDQNIGFDYVASKYKVYRRPADTATGHTNTVCLTKKQDGTSSLTGIGSGTLGYDFNISDDGEKAYFRTNNGYSNDLLSGTNVGDLILMYDEDYPSPNKIKSPIKTLDGSITNGAINIFKSVDGKKMLTNTVTSQSFDWGIESDSAVSELSLLYDDDTGRARVVSLASDGSMPDNNCSSQALSGDGKHLIFSTVATNILPSSDGTTRVYKVDIDEQKDWTMSMWVKSSENRTETAAFEAVLGSPNQNTSLAFGRVNGSNIELRRDISRNEFALMTFNSSSARWEGNITPSYITSTSSFYMSPSSTSDTVKRWTSPITGTINITGSVIVVSTTSNGINVEIKKNDFENILPSTLVTPSTIYNYNFNVDVVCGDTIDFVINANSNANFDDTVFTSTITNGTLVWSGLSNVFNKDGWSYLERFSNTENSFNLTTSTAIYDNKWHHLAMTSNENGATNDISLYVDGKQVSTTATSINIGAFFNNSPMTLGKSLLSNSYWQGRIDNFAIYPYAMTSSDVQASMYQSDENTVYSSAKTSVLQELFYDPNENGIRSKNGLIFDATPRTTNINNSALWYYQEADKYGVGNPYGELRDRNGNPIASDIRDIQLNDKQTYVNIKITTGRDDKDTYDYDTSLQKCQWKNIN